MNEWGLIKVTTSQLSSWDGTKVFSEGEEVWVLIREALGAVRSGFAELLDRQWKPIEDDPIEAQSLELPAEPVEEPPKRSKKDAVPSD